LRSMPTISSASVRLATTATDTVAPSMISTPLVLCPWAATGITTSLGSPAVPMDTWPRPVGGPPRQSDGDEVGGSSPHAHHQGHSAGGHRSGQPFWKLPTRAACHLLR